MAIYDTMQFVPCDVSTVCFGMAASMGAFLLGAGPAPSKSPRRASRRRRGPPRRPCDASRRHREDSVLAPGAGARGKRKSLPNARIMIHQPLGGAQGQAADIEIQAKEILFTKAVINTYMADYTGQPADKLAEDTDRDFYMMPGEAKDYGLIDEVIKTKTSDIKLGNVPML